MGEMKMESRENGAGGEEADTLFEEHLEDALCVFKSGGINSDILKQNEKQILFFLDLENEEVVNKEEVEQDLEDGD
tara:strand:+ start:92 stop:319 length:228 start_codon:yes stop_codon:yes gene_type:complete